MGKLPPHSRFIPVLARGTLATKSWRGAHSPSSIRRSSTNLPAQVDLLQRYRGLVVLGRVQEDDEQIRVIMQVSNIV